MERPASIVKFEYVYLARIALGLVAAALTWNTAIATASANPAAAQLGSSFVPTIMVGGLILGTAISLLLWYFAARKAAVVAKWIIVVFFVIGILGKVMALANGTVVGGVTGVVSLIDLVLGAIAVWFLFQPDARVWFGETKAA